MVIDGLMYTKDHEWIKVDGNIVTMGISDYAQELLGEITFVEMPETESQIEIHDELAVVESSKAASDVYSPVAGKVIEINDALENSPDLINDDCYTSGWICKIEIAAKVSNPDLMDAKVYEEYLVGL